VDQKISGHKETYSDFWWVLMCKHGGKSRYFPERSSIVASFHYPGNQKISLIGKNRGKFNQANKAFVTENL